MDPYYIDELLYFEIRKPCIQMYMCVHVGATHQLGTFCSSALAKSIIDEL